ncbi:hypothetical protein FA95DRAFT_1565539 [Auriscalpium vulgare]|uniref:Uncharacterized protein n=1 Tax=Auriscalpium vulgare TaxID=40419 RepID=A0ACB8RBL5_9AGAM|nr:hypothetical protein FA95DRAFT_1565539 [Auriscalpium vulgare]
MLAFLDLPDELLQAILSDLDHHNILACQTTCCKLKTLVDSSMQLQYIIDLAAAGLCEGPTARPFNISERLRRLRAYEAARAGPIALAELPFVPALVGNPLRVRVSVTTLITDVLEEDGHMRVYVQQMPSPVRGIEERHWSIRLAKRTYVAAVDASQDMLVVINPPRAVSILSLSTGERHSSATVTKIALPRDAYTVTHVEVFGEYLAAMCGRNADVWVTIWNWRTADNEIELRSPRMGPHFKSQSKFTFLSSTHIAIPSDRAEAILVYSFIRTEEARPPPTVFILPKSASETLVMLRRCSDVAGTRHAGYFHPAPAARMFSLAITPAPWRSERLELAVPAETLLAHVPAAKAVPWARWGPKGCVLLRGCQSGQNASLGLGASAMRLVMQDDKGVVRADGAPVYALTDHCRARVVRGTGGVLVEPFETPGSKIMGWPRSTRRYAVKQFSMPLGSEDRRHAIIVCEDLLIVLLLGEFQHENSVAFAKAWACTV